MQILIRTPTVPDSILQLIRCTCSKNHCAGRCSCRQHDMPCTELCKCDPDGYKHVMNFDNDDDGNDDIENN